MFSFRDSVRLMVPQYAVQAYTQTYKHLDWTVKHSWCFDMNPDFFFKLNEEATACHLVDEEATAWRHNQTCRYGRFASKHPSN